MNYQYWSVFFGIMSMALFQIEQGLRTSLDKLEKGRPIYSGTWLPRMAFLSEKLKAHKEAVANLASGIWIFRIGAIVIGVISIILGGLK